MAEEQPLEGRTLELSDINDATFCSLFDDIPVTQAKRAGRVYWLVPASPRTYEVLAKLREDPPVPILTFIRHLKKMRAMMLDYRDRKDDDGNGNGDHYGNHSRP
ncbi:MAG: hypothetical protein ABSD38_26485 [Syntrophorhabdales bacterium]|jgi:hypothetical protein